VTSARSSANCPFTSQRNGSQSQRLRTWRKTKRGRRRSLKRRGKFGSLSSKEKTEPRELWGFRHRRKFGDIRRKKVWCALCRLVNRSLDNVPPAHKLCDGDDIYYYRNLFGEYRREGAQIKYLTSRLCVSTHPARLDPVRYEHARSLQAGKHETIDTEVEIILVENDKNNSLFQGRRVGDQVNFDLCKRWLDICEECHGEACAPVPPHESRRTPSRLIDVEKRMVVFTPPGCSYAALSYCCGRGVNRLTLTRTNSQRYEQLTSPGGLGDHWNDIPHTIKDAITICSKLSVQYLWVDALCIDQDDSEVVRDQMSIMDAIYSGAVFTIVDGEGGHSWTGLPGVGNTTRPKQKMAKVGCLMLSTAQPTLESSLKDSSWNDRAWTF